MANLPLITFYVSAAILLFAALRVITARNPVHAALWLVLAFFTAADLWLLLYAEFLAVALVLVYVGAVMVLFLFVVMMLDINFDKLREGFWRHLPLAGEHRLPDGARDGAGGRLARVRRPVGALAGRAAGRATPTPRSWGASSTPTTCSPSSWPPWCCWWPSSPPSRSRCAAARRRATRTRPCSSPPRRPGA